MQRRTGFTLVEMMVAMALTVFIMVILAQAFVTGLETFRQLKGLGDMQAKLRVAGLRLRSDLRAAHFEADRKLSDINFWGDGNPKQGFFYLSMPAATSEGTDGDGLPSYQAASTILHFTIDLRGNERDDFLQASVPATSTLLSTSNTTLGNQPADARLQDPTINTYTSAWGEVAYFMLQQGDTVEPNNPNSAAGGTPLYTLYRAQKVLVPNGTTITNDKATNYPEMSCQQVGNNVQFFSPVDLASTPANRFAVPTPGAASLLDNVISFQVQMLVRQKGQLVWSPANPTTAGAFDTAGANPGYTVVAVQITLRVWDVATQQARQVTIFQDL